MAVTQLSKYEKDAIAAIHAWKHPSLTWAESAMKIINKPIEFVSEGAMKIPGVDLVTVKALGGIVSLLNDGAAWTVRPQAIFKDFPPTVSQLEHIHSVDLQTADKAVGYLAAKYKAYALVEGTAAGGASNLGPVVGAAAIAADIVALLTLNLRAVNEYATYYGFDVTHQQERIYALNILGLASSPNDASKVVAMAQLVKIAQQAAQKKAWKELEKHVFVQLVQRIANALTVRLTKAKLAQIVPVAGAAIGGGFNAYYTTGVCNAAYYLYRERFLARRYGVDIIEATVEPAAAGDFGEGYEDG